MISTVTGFKLLRLEEIGFFEYLKDKRQWQVVLFNQTRLNLKRNTNAEDIVSYSQAFVQISQSAIVNVNYLAMIDGKCCQLYPPDVYKRQQQKEGSFSNFTHCSFLYYLFLNPFIFTLSKEVLFIRIAAPNLSLIHI